MFKPYMETARSFASLSYAKRKKVGAIAITPQDIILYSWNGTAIGTDNNCEDEDGKTLETTLHAEANIVSKAAREGLSLRGSTIFCTLAPCVNCSKQMLQSGVVRVVYEEDYRHTAGVKYLRKHGVIVEKYDENI